MPLEMLELSREFVFFRVDAPNPLTSETVEVAFKPPTVEPAEVDWNTAILVTPQHELGDGSNIFIAILLGPDGTVTLPKGDHQAWVRITGTTERPVRKPGVVTIL